MPDKWNGTCGPHCPHYGAHVLCGRMMYNDHHCYLLEDIVAINAPCSVPPTGPWVWDMEQAPKDGSEILVLFQHPNLQSSFMSFRTTWDYDHWFGCLTVTPIAFAIINKPWEMKGDD
jgi:hypothetical protein